MKCCVCEGDGWFNTSLEGIIECAFCQIRRREEFPNPQEVKKNYDSDYFEQRVKKRHPGELTARLSIMDRINLLNHKSFLEFGCEDGWLLQEIRNQGKDVAGIEINPAMIEKLKQKRIACVENVENLPRDKWDVVMSWHFLEHLIDPRYFVEKQFELSKHMVMAHVPTNDLEYDNRDHLWHFQEEHLKNLFNQFAKWTYAMNSTYDLNCKGIQAKVTTIVGIV